MDLEAAAILRRARELAQAIRRGAKIRPQVYGNTFSEGGSCAWGAAWEGCGHAYQEGKSYEGKSYAAILGHWGDVNNVFTDKYGCGIAVTNDSRVSREKIADMLDALGKDYAAPQVAVPGSPDQKVDGPACVAPRLSDAEFTKRFVAEVENVSPTPTPATCPD